MNIMKNLTAARDNVVSAMNRCHADTERKLSLGAELSAWEKILDFARLTNCDKGSSPKVLQGYIKDICGEEHSEKRRKFVRVALDTKDSDFKLTKEPNAIDAYYKVFGEAQRLVA